jgi:hypothetical protein
LFASNKPFEWTGHRALSAHHAKAPCLPLKGSVRRTKFSSYQSALRHDTLTKKQRRNNDMLSKQSIGPPNKGPITLHLLGTFLADI